MISACSVPEHIIEKHTERSEHVGLNSSTAFAMLKKEACPSCAQKTRQCLSFLTQATVHHPTETAMIPRKLLGSAQTPDKAGELQLSQRGDDFFIAYNGKELMNSRMHGSEDLLAEFACKPVAGRPKARVLVGGLGLGYTLAATLAIIKKDAAFKKELNYLLDDPQLFYSHFSLVLTLWPQEVKQKILKTIIPYQHTKGISLLRASETLPHPFRKKMLIKIIGSDINETFRLNAESSLAKHAPEEFIRTVIKPGYKKSQYINNQIIKFFQEFSYEESKKMIKSSLRMGSYWKIGYICEALINKEINKELKIKELQNILEERNNPIERILLRRLRHHLNHSYFTNRKKAGSQNESNTL
jgi:hypothetical protein